ncbi:MAG: glycosyltransferase family 4 protein [Opitutaceae bacterium]|nr:glycosyltransferase family 4 protein [Opitutaceae bacterium]
MTDRWLVLAHEATNSGAPRMLLEVLRGVRAARGSDWRCDILLDRGGPLAEELATIGQVQRLTPPWAEGMAPLARSLRTLVDRPWLKPRRLRRAVRTWQAQGGGVIYSNTATNGRLLAGLPASAGPVVTHVHELEYSLQRFNRPQDLAATLARTSLFLAVSTAVAADLRARGVPAERVKVVPNFLPALPALPDAAAAQKEICRRLRLAPETRLITGCGHIDPLKGTDLFVDVVNQVAASTAGPLAGVWLGGDIDRRFAQRVRSAAGGCMHFIGEVPDPALYFAASEVVVVTSRVESFSRVALEAAALGRPVLAFAAARGPADLLPPEALVTELSAEAMAAAVIAALADPAGSRRQGESLRRRVAGEFLAAQWIGRLLAAVEEVSRG